VDSLGSPVINVARLPISYYLLLFIIIYYYLLLLIDWLSTRLGHNGKYWSVESDGNICANQASPQPFIFEFRAHSKMAIKAPNGCYVRGEQNGIMSATSKEFDRNKTVMWEY